MTWNYLAFNLGATAYFIIGAYFEDKKLAEDFGAAYQAYQASTPAFLPRWKSLFK
jgi:protein-S-isoprenylcysteine O-methyltransferase Ste14